MSGEIILTTEYSGRCNEICNNMFHIFPKGSVMISNLQVVTKDGKQIGITLLTPE